VVENLISSGIEDHTFGPMNLRIYSVVVITTNALINLTGFVIWFARSNATLETKPQRDLRNARSCKADSQWL